MSIFRRFFRKIKRQDVWARPEMPITFRAEIMPGKSLEQRTFRVKEVLSSGRVRLHDFIGEHAENSFEPVSFKKRRF